jgi:hypothetical protein
MNQIDRIPGRPNYAALFLMLGGGVIFATWVYKKHGGA